MIDIDTVEETCEINPDWYYHSSHYKRNDYKNILTEGLKCNYLLNRSWSGRYNGPFYISLSKITIPDNICFLNYILSSNPSFVLEGIEPIECKQRHDYEKYIATKDKRRIGNFVGEYQYYYWIENSCIIGLVYNLYNYINQTPNSKSDYHIKKLLEIFDLLEELDVNIPIYDYSRRDKTLAHEINKEKIKYYTKNN